MVKRLTIGFVRTVVLSGIGAAHRVLGDALWPPLEVIAGGVGAVIGRAARPMLRQEPGAHPLASVMRLTNIIEGSLGIEGTDQYGDGTARRLVHHCPYAEKLRGTPQVCLRLGFVGGQKAFAQLVPDGDYEIRTTQSQGSGCCEYVFWIK